MDTLPLELIGWVYSVGCSIALLAGAWLTIGVHKLGVEGRRELAARLLEDLLLFSIWLLGLAGGVGVLAGKAWSRPALELFCWTLMVLLLISAARRLRAVPPPRLMLGLSLALFVAPVIAICVATILTLRSEAAVKQLSGIGRILPA
ncbi:MAG TPA: hypothetical protein VLV90_01150 [Burkholderiales bacterium]|nr:hypothetical protein [Burkholderiales bacterium]